MRSVISLTKSSPQAFGSPPLPDSRSRFGIAGTGKTRLYTDSNRSLLLLCHFATAVWPETCRGSEPCERRVARERRETASAGPSPAQVTDLRLLQPVPGAAVSRAVERFAERHVPANIRDMTSSTSARRRLHALRGYRGPASQGRCQ